MESVSQAKVQLPETDELFQTKSLDEVRSVLADLKTQRDSESRKLTECFGDLHSDILTIATRISELAQSVHQYKGSLNQITAAQVGDYKNSVPLALEAQFGPQKTRALQANAAHFWQRVAGLADFALVTKDHLLLSRCLYLAKNLKNSGVAAKRQADLTQFVDQALKQWLKTFDHKNLRSMICCYLTFYEASPQSLITRFVESRAEAISAKAKQSIDLGILEADQALQSLALLQSVLTGIKITDMLLPVLDKQHPEAGLASLADSAQLSLQLPLFPQQCSTKLGRSEIEGANNMLASRISQALAETARAALAKSQSGKLVDWFSNTVVRIRESAELGDLYNGKLISQTIFPLFEQELQQRVLELQTGLDTVLEQGESDSLTAIGVASELDLSMNAIHLSSKLSQIAQGQTGCAANGVLVCNEWDNNTKTLLGQLQQLSSPTLDKSGCKTLIDDLCAKMNSELKLQTEKTWRQAAARVKEHFAAEMPANKLAGLVTVCRRLQICAGEPIGLEDEMINALADAIVQAWDYEMISTKLETFETVGVYMALESLARDMQQIGSHFEWTENAVSAVRQAAIAKLAAHSEFNQFVEVVKLVFEPSGDEESLETVGRFRLLLEPLI